MYLVSILSLSTNVLLDFWNVTNSVVVFFIFHFIHKLYYGQNECKWSISRIVNILKKTEHLIKPHTFLKFEVEMPFSMRVIPISRCL
jgi:hypothetical protein